jgi:IS1 family transposase
LGFVGCKEKTRIRKNYGDQVGDAYCFTAIERNSKLLLTWHVGKRSTRNTEAFAGRLREVTEGRFQVTTDGYGPYKTAIPQAFQGQVDYAQLIKSYGNAPEGPSTRYSPGQILVPFPVDDFRALRGMNAVIASGCSMLVCVCKA